jgi:hypothetical protein
MTWTTFANLGVGPGTTPQLDANFSILSALVPIPCTATGTNTITLTSIEGAAAIAAYQQNMIFTAIAANTNTGAATAQFGSLAALPIYKDAQAGPVALSGSEIVQFCQFALSYDLALNSGAGGFHLQTGSGILTGQTLSVGTLTANSISATSLGGSVGAFASLSIAGGDGVVRLTSTIATITLVTMTPGNTQLHTIPFTGAQLNDVISVGLPNISGDFSFIAYVGATGSVIFVAQNFAATVTLVAQTLVFRVTAMGFVT